MGVRINENNLKYILKFIIYLCFFKIQNFFKSVIFNNNHSNLGISEANFQWNYNYKKNYKISTLI